MAEKKLQFILRDAGYGSRRKVDEMVFDGRVTINGKTADQPAIRTDPERDHIKVDGKLLQPQDLEKKYFILNKPRNVVSTLSDPQGRPCVGDLVKRLGKGLFSVGRLDYDAEGLIILTNDGEFAQKMSHPSYEVPRTYAVKIQGSPAPEALAKIKKGMIIGDGERLGEVEVTVTKRQKRTTWVRVVLREGKKHEIKRMFDRIRHPARRIRRISFGPFALGSLQAGNWRTLTGKEAAHVRAILRGEDLKNARQAKRTRVRPKPPGK